MEKYKIAYGITSQTADDSHIFISDIDKDIPLDQVKAYCKVIQKHFGLSDIYIMKSNHGYNLISLDKLPLKLVYQINHTIPCVDKVFNRLAFLNRGLYVLRTLPRMDKFYLCTVFNGCHDPTWMKSNSHRVFFSNFLNINIFKDNHFDDNEVIHLCQFKNKKYGWLEE